MNDHVTILLTKLGDRVSSGEKLMESEALMYDSMCRNYEAFFKLQRLYCERTIAQMEKELDKESL